MEPREGRCLDACGAERECFADVRDSEPRGACFKCRPGHGDGPMTVGVRLHDGHHAGRLRDRLYNADVVADSLEIDDGATLRKTSSAFSVGVLRFPDIG